jgi:hypothetical protein
LIKIGTMTLTSRDGDREGHECGFGCGGTSTIPAFTQSLRLRQVQVADAEDLFIAGNKAAALASKSCQICGKLLAS